MKIAIQGTAGSFHSLAAKRLFGETAELVFCESFKEVFATLKAGRTDRAVVAIENSLYGSINDVYDLLLKNHFHITHEIYEQIGLHLLGSDHVDLSEVTDVYSQAPALAEAEEFLDQHLPQATRHEFFDTAAAAAMIAEKKDTSKVAVASQVTADLYNLAILAKNIETHHHNYTRFIALSESEITTKTANKTSITFRTADTPGSLHAALGVFAKADINLTKLESRPIVGEAWQYMYYVDFAAGLHEPRVASALKELESFAENIRVLGSYEAGSMMHT